MCGLWDVKDTLNMLTAKVVAAPFDENALGGADMRIGGDGGAQALAVSSLVAGTCIKDTPVQNIDRLNSAIQY